VDDDFHQKVQTFRELKRSGNKDELKKFVRANAADEKFMKFVRVAAAISAGVMRAINARLN